jgi:hypothetical protein
MSDSDSDSDHNPKLKQPVKTPKITEEPINVEAPFDNNCLFIDGLSDLCSDETVKLYLTLLINETLDEKFKIEYYRRNNSRVMVRFNREIYFDQIVAKQLKMPELCGELIKFYRVKVTNAVKITNLPLNCNEEILSLYFTNTKISDGSDIDRIRLFSFENKALISFKNFKVVNKVLARSHTLSGMTVKVEEFYGPIEDESFADDDGDDVMVVSKSMVNKKDQKARPRKINIDHPLSSSLVSSGGPLADRTKIIIANLQENINIQQLDFFIQLLTNKSEVQNVSWSFEMKGKLLVEFEREIDLKKILHEYHKSSMNNLNGKLVQIEPVNTTRTLIVVIKELKNFKESSLKLEPLSPNVEDENEISKIPATRDLLELYFVNKQRSGGGEIEVIERRSARYWLIKMKDQRVFKEILSRKHIVDFKEIKVFPYYENFGLPYLVHFNQDYSSKTELPYKLKIKDDRLRYFVKVKNLHQKLNEILSESNAVSKYNSNDSNTLFIQYHRKLNTFVPYIEKIWQIRVKECIEYFLQIYKYEKMTLSYNQWSTILKTKQINEALLYKQNDSVDIDEDFDGGRIIDNDGESNRNKFFGNLAVISVKDTTTNIEINAVGPTLEVDKFIVKVKDIICKAYFTYELEERIITFKTYLLDCEQLLSKWLQDRDFDSDEDSDVDILLSSSRANLNDTSSLRGSFTTKKRDEDYSSSNGKLDKTKRKTIDEFITKLEREHMEMELSYGKLFQELGYTFLSKAPILVSHEENEEDADAYRTINDYSVIDETYLGTTKNEVESEMDRIKHTLDELKQRISEMRKKFRQYLMAVKKAKKLQQKPKPSAPVLPNSHNRESLDIEEDDEEDDEDLIKICVFVREQMKIITLNIHNKCKIKELKLILSKQIDENEAIPIDSIKLTFNGIELINDNYTIAEYGISNKCTITCEIDLE